MTGDRVPGGESIGLFPGQGSQFVGMGSGLVRRFAEASAVFDEASDAIDVDLRALCWQSSASHLALTENAQLAIGVCSIAAWRVYRADPSTDVPHAVAGHSVGALPAAMASGHLALRDGMRLVRRRSLLMGGVPRTGSMIAVSVTSDAMLQQVLEGAERLSLDVAARNGARQVVLSGTLDAIDAAKSHFGARSRVLEVSNGFHSRLMDPIVEEWTATVAAVELRDVDGPTYVASTSGEPASTSAEVAADLAAGLRHTVRWDAVIADPNRTRWVTFGPGSALARFGRGLIRTDDITNVDDSYASVGTAIEQVAHAG